MEKRRRRFGNEKSAREFAKEVNGSFNDLRKVKEANSPFTVTYRSTQYTKKHGKAKSYGVSQSDQSPEDDRDFGYPNYYWKD